MEVSAACGPIVWRTSQLTLVILKEGLEERGTKKLVSLVGEIIHVPFLSRYRTVFLSPACLADIFYVAASAHRHIGTCVVSLW